MKKSFLIFTIFLITITLYAENKSTEQPPEMNQQELTGAGGMDLILEQLEKEGYDLSGIRTAIENGDRETARTMLEQYMKNTPEFQ